MEERNKRKKSYVLIEYILSKKYIKFYNSNFSLVIIYI